MQVLSRRPRPPLFGGSTGTEFLPHVLASRLRVERTRGSIVSLICDSGERYAHTYYSDDWITAQGFDLAPHERTLDAFLDGAEASLHVS